VPGAASANTLLATLELGESRPPGCSSIGRTVWYRVVPDASGRLVASTAGSGYDTILAVYASDPAGRPGALLACNDDFPPGLQSRVLVDVAAGQPYYLQAGGWAGSGGRLALAVSMAASGTTP
jgi:hypothetical protein